MKSKSIVKFAIVILIIATLGYIAAYGLTIGDYHIASVTDEENGIKKGMDLAGGATILFEADTDNVADGDMAAVVEVLRTRLDSAGQFEATVAQQGKKRVRVEIPAVMDTQEAIDLLGTTAKLEFRDKDGNVVLKGEQVKKAQSVYDTLDSSGKKGYQVRLELTSEGRKAFAEATERVAGYSSDNTNYIAIYLDDTVVSSPRVQEKIDSETCVINGDFTAEDSKTLASQIQSGKLPFSIKVVESRTIGASLGEDALARSVKAGAIGFVLVVLYMIIMYRLCGFISGISLAGYITLVLMILSWFKINLTLPGIAGIILTIGTAVDANVIIFERVKEELRLGKTLRASVDAGFKRAFTAILDANVTTLIAAVVLYFFGTGSIKGFAVTLFIGTLVSMFTAIVVTRFLLQQLIGFNIKNSKLYSA